jgi:hypothetical protein
MKGDNPFGNSYWEMKSLIILSIKFNQSNCEGKNVRITDHQLDRLSVDPIHFMSFDAMQKVDSGRTGLQLGAASMT